MNVSIDLSDVYLKTERLTIRPFIEKDLERIYKYSSNPKIAAMAGFIRHKDLAQSKELLDNYLVLNNSLAVCLDDKLIGSITIERYPENILPEFKHLWGRDIGFILDEDYWGQGYMPEALKIVIDYLFRVEDLDFLSCGHFLYNDQSRRVQEKCGFKHYKLARHIGPDGGENTAWISILYR